MSASRFLEARTLMTAVTIGGANEAVRASIAKSIAAWHGGDRARIRVLLVEMLAPHVAADLLRRVLLRLRTAANGTGRKFDDEWTKYHTCMVNGEPSRAYQRWASECSKRSRSMTMALHKRVDFKVQPLSYSESLSAERKLLAQAK